MEDVRVIEASSYWESLRAAQGEPHTHISRVKRILNAEAIIREVESRISEAEKDGVMSGLHEGIMIGVKVGKLEANKENARKMLSMNLSIEDIMAITDLSKEKIQELAMQAQIEVDVISK